MSFGRKIHAYRILATQCNNPLLDLTLCSIKPIKERDDIFSFFPVYPFFLLVICCIDVLSELL